MLEELLELFGIGGTIEKCYNVGENITSVSATQRNGNIAGATHANFTGSVTLSYYLSSSTMSGIGEGKGSGKWSTEAKTEALFKSPVTNTSSVAYLLNGSKTSGEWSQDDSINDGYPYLVNNVPE
jgi:hypothetical protein